MFVSLSVASPLSNVTAVQTSATTVLVSWSPSGNATGYRIDYDDSGDHNVSVTVSNGSTDEYTLTGLQNETYIISIVATSEHFYSDALTVTVVGKIGIVYNIQLSTNMAFSL